MDLNSKKVPLYVTLALAMMTGKVSAAFAEPVAPTQVSQPAKKIQGVVVDQNGEPIIGASVIVKGQSTGAATDIDGKFAFSAEPGATLQVSYIGYLPKTVKATSSPMRIVLQEDTKSLDDVVVVGYGTMKKKLLTGATVQVKGDDLQKLNTTSPLQALQGQAAGVTIMSTSGQPGADMKVNIRGLGTVGDSQPLYIIDGIGGDITTLNPADIASIDVLKDAASAAIYGSAGANGVVLVTTKNGNYGQKPQITFDGYMGWQSAARKSNLLNAEQYKTIMDEAALNSGNSVYDWSSYGDLADTDWVGTMFKDNVKTESYSLGINGGTSGSTYAVSLGYMNQGGIVGGSDCSDYSRYNFRINSEQKLFKDSDLLKIGEQVSFIYKKNHGIDVDNAYNNTLRGAFNTSPLSPVYDADGSYHSTLDQKWNDEDGNPYGVMQMTNKKMNKNANFNGNIYAELQPIKNLKIRTVFGAVYNSSDYRSWRPEYQFSKYSKNDKEKVTQSNYQGWGLTWTNTASYDWTMGEHAFNVLIGMESYRYSGTSISAEQATLKEGFSDWEHAYVSNGTAGTTGDGLSAKGSPATESRKVSYFGRVGWNWKERYMINATVRRDGSSNFAKGHRYGTFPSVSAGWTITNEKFAEPAQDWLDFFKLRLSWGQVGNASIPAYRYLAPITTGDYNNGYSNAHYFFGNDLSSTSSTLASNYGMYPARLANEEVTWETSEQFNVGFDARFFNSRLSVNFDYYIKNTKDWLVEAPVLATAGTKAPYINGGNVKNRGVELAVSWNDQIGKDFTYGISVNGAYNHNEVGEIPTEDGIIHGVTGSVLYDNSGEFYRAQNGHAIGYFWGYKTAGIFQNQKEINDWISAGNGVLQSDVKPGDVKYIDVNHDGVIDDSDKVDLGSGNPKFTYGFNINLGYKHFDFSLTANGAAGQKIVQSYRNQTAKYANYTTAILDRWTGEGTSNKMPRVTLENINWQFSDLYVQDGDYLRISNITLGYDFAHLWNQKVVSQARLYFQVQNAFTFTKYDGLDPEIGFGNKDGNGYSWVSGVDYGYYPRPRTFLVGLNLKF